MVAACDYLSNVSALSTWWVDMSKCRGMVGQSKMSPAATEKRNKSKINPGLGWSHYSNSWFWHITVNGGMVVLKLNSHHWSLGSVFWHGQVCSVFIAMKLACRKRWSSWITRLCVSYVSWLLQNEGDIESWKGEKWGRPWKRSTCWKTVKRFISNECHFSEM